MSTIETVITCLIAAGVVSTLLGTLLLWFVLGSDNDKDNK